MNRYGLLLLLCLYLPGYAQNKTAANFVLPDLNGENYNLEKNLDQGPILINFWATWCIPCREEMKKLKKIYRRYEKAGFVILSISIDEPKTVGKVKSFINTYRYPFKVLLDTNQRVFKLYAGRDLPYSLLLDKTGQIIYTHTGYRKGDEKKLEKEIAKLIKKTEK